VLKNNRKFLSAYKSVSYGFLKTPLSHVQIYFIPTTQVSVVKENDNMQVKPKWPMKLTM
jgi:hypothetical protein